MVIIKQFFADEDKLRAKMAERKAKAASNPKEKKKSRFQEKLEEMQKKQLEMKNKNFECGKFLEEECVKASFELSDSFFNSNLTNTSTIKNEISPFNFNKNSSKVFLTKKRKNSDLNFEIFETYSNSKNSKKNSPFLSDSKITNYFQQKKNSSSRKSSELRSSNKSAEMKSMGSSFGNYSKDNLEEENKISCAKKLIFENVPQS